MRFVFESAQRLHHVLFMALQIFEQHAHPFLFGGITQAGIELADLGMQGLAEIEEVPDLFATTGHLRTLLMRR
jgi:hypothetical protein